MTVNYLHVYNLNKNMCQCSTCKDYFSFNFFVLMSNKKPENATRICDSLPRLQLQVGKNYILNQNICQGSIYEAHWFFELSWLMDQ